MDPISLASGPPLRLGETLLKHATPVRVGLVLAPSTANPLLEAAVRSAFNYVAQEKNSNKEAYYFLTQVTWFIGHQKPPASWSDDSHEDFGNSRDSIGTGSDRTGRAKYVYTKYRTV